MSDDGEHEVMVRVEEPLIEEEDSIQNDQIGTTLNICNYLKL